LNKNPTNDQLSNLLKLYKSGSSSKAENIALKITQDFPNHPFAWKILSILLKNKGEVNESLNINKKLIQISPKDPEIHNNIGNIYFELGKLNNAKNSYSKAINLNNNYFIAYCNLGNVFLKTSKINDAKLNFKKAISCKSDFIGAYIGLGNALETDGDYKEAESLYEKVINIRNDIPEIYFNLGNILQKQEKFEDAIINYKNAIKLNPKFVEAYNNLGNIFQKHEKFEDAIINYKNAIKLNPKFVEAYNNLGNIHQKKAQHKKAIINYKEAIKLNTKSPETYNNLGNIFRDLGNLNESEFYLRKAIEFKPSYAKAYSNLSNTLEKMGKLDEAILANENALKYNPDYFTAEAHLLHQKRKICDFNIEKKNIEFCSKLDFLKESIPPFITLSFIDNSEKQYLVAKSYAKENFTNSKSIKIQNFKYKKEKIKIGYFSADFYDYPSMHLIIGLLENHNRELFDIYAFSYGPNNNDWMNNRIKSAVDHFIDIRNIQSEEVVKIVNEKKIDISIDLNGYTYNSRTELFQNRLSPIQINYLGYPGTLGANFIDYIVADQITIPKNQRRFYSEKVIYLPHTYQPNDSQRKISNNKTLRSDFGLPDSFFVLCCFNNTFKISSKEYEIWIKILKKIDKSVLWLLNSNIWAKENLVKKAKKMGIDTSRIIFAEKLANSEHLARYRHADLFVDTFNYNAHTTASDALWAGLPVITKKGNQFAANVASSLLNAIDLPELITKNEQDYENLIFELATNPKKLEKIKNKLLNNKLNKPLFDTKKYTRNFENGLLQAFNLYSKGQQPQDIKVADIN
jgi:predicted O-linked N-acetylglucosamine transferase (SPINDLY family)